MDEAKDFMFSDKAAARKALLDMRAKTTDKPARSIEIAKRALSLVRGAVMTYTAIGSEVDTSFLNAELVKRDDIVLFAPYTVDGKIFPRRVKKFGLPDARGNMSNDCYCSERNNKGILLDYCITPLVGFNGRGYRIGYGQGCYDRFFSEFAPLSYKIGLAFENQLANFKEEPHDMPLDCCVTEKKVIYF